MRSAARAIVSADHPQVGHETQIMALEIRPNCECCDKDLTPDSPEAYICTFECTYCRECASDKLGFVCANCGGELVRRPIRPMAKLIGNPASNYRVQRSSPCVPFAGRG
jgi:hypothetical protein